MMRESKAEPTKWLERLGKKACPIFSVENTIYFNHITFCLLGGICGRLSDDSGPQAAELRDCCFLALKMR
jgi:hypothetical protein